MSKYSEIKLTKDELRKIIYFILMKFRGDPLHHQGTSAKRDLIGGYIERWFNKIAESVIFDKLLEGKSYKAVSDYFIYANDSDKNAPDIIGLDKNGIKIPFVKYCDGTWKNVPNMPRVEVKVVRKDQSLVSVREPQMIDDYYAFIESDLEGDYLTAIFEEETFGDKYFKQLVLGQEFIESDKDNQIIPHAKVTKTKTIGTMRLIGIYTKEELKRNSVMCGKKVSPYYLGGVSNTNLKSKTRLNEKLVCDKDGRFTYKYDNSYISLPISINADGKAKITIIKKNKGSIYLHSNKAISIAGVELKEGDIKIDYKKFERSSGWEEHIVLKGDLEKYGKDSTTELVKIFDRLAR
ncbi:MAG: hypothetical protein NT041_01100 [Candidatus Vogelbacteria bacterium]|nr:hypothetical protein [Candidatus Vogelbacteria bacterium]